MLPGRFRLYDVPMPAVIFLVVYALATARVTRLVTADRLTEAPRERVTSWLWQRAVRRDAIRARVLGMRPATTEEPLAAYLATCPWCASIWIGAVAAPLIWAWGEHPWLWVPALALALSEVTGLLARGEN
jgi:hypothetical protein